MRGVRRLGRKNSIRIIERAETPTCSSPLKTLGALENSVREYLRKYPIKQADISCGGPLDSATGVIINPPNLQGWENFPIVAYIQNMYALSARLENDANACAVAEWKFGAGIGSKNMVFMRSAELLTPSMNAVMQRETLGQSNAVCKIVPAKLSENVGDITGNGGGSLKEYAIVTVAVPETETYKVQELHLPVYHTLCAMLEEEFF